MGNLGEALEKSLTGNFSHFLKSINSLGRKNKELRQKRRNAIKMVDSLSVEWRLSGYHPDYNFVKSIINDLNNRIKEIDDTIKVNTATIKELEKNGVS